ncbi:neurochondrin homolog [Centruroides sculpturatus]|uniref:neurochondrin homolog n=1 Tax=Centruroides sculpturatus TaxID=218467 RepID=UPI000C6C8FA5|nr:neurochondrin homolog [Centruroides sculpturatus]
MSVYRETFNSLILSLKEAETDTQKFATLLAVVDFLKKNELSNEDKVEVSEALDLQFLRRLLHTSKLPEGCSEHVFRAVALNVLTYVCTDAYIQWEQVLLEEISVLKEIISTCPATSEEENMVKDSLQCILFLATKDRSHQTVLLENEIDRVLANICVEGSYGYEMALHILLTTFSSEGRNTLPPKTFTNLMNKLTDDFYKDHSSKKFELCHVLTDILQVCANIKVCQEEQWLFTVRYALYDILRSKLSKEYRDSALKLASTMMEKFGSVWLIDESEGSRKFLALLINLACIESQVLLHNKKINEVIKDLEVLVSCYSILEYTVSLLVEDGLSHWTDPNMDQILVALKDTFNIIIQFFINVSKEWDSVKDLDACSTGRVRQVTCATFRILCCWLAEETSMLRNEVYEALPFMIKISKSSVRAVKDSKQRPNAALFQIWNVDMMRFILPVLCHLSADDNARKILLDEEIPITLLDYLQFQWNAMSTSSKAEEISIILSTLCSILLNIVVFERKNITKNEIFFQLLKFLFSALSTLHSGSKFLQLKANFAVLGLMISGYYYNRIRLCETSFCKFLSASVKFLWDAHHIEDTSDSTSFVLDREYRKIWQDIMELWFLGMQALSNLLSCIPWISTFLLESGWPQHIVTQLSRVSEPCIEGSIKTAYQHFLYCIIKTCPEAIQALLDCEIVKVCRVHKLKELESLFV